MDTILAVDRGQFNGVPRVGAGRPPELFGTASA
jgi:hypothetical protein